MLFPGSGEPGQGVGPLQRGLLQKGRGGRRRQILEDLFGQESQRDGKLRDAEPQLPNRRLPAGHASQVGHPVQRSAVAALSRDDELQAGQLLRGGSAQPAGPRRSGDFQVFLSIFPARGPAAICGRRLRSLLPIARDLEEYEAAR